MTSMNQLYSVKLENGEQIPAVYVNENENPSNVLKLLRITNVPRPAIFITGGASNMSPQDRQQTFEIFDKGIAPFAEKHQIIVIDGATKSGVIEMMATARAKNKFTFPLIGIAPFKKITYAGKPRVAGEEVYPLCPGHSHFVFVGGQEFGAESEMIIFMSHMAAGGIKDNARRNVPAAGIVINGGKITRQEAFMATTKHLSIPLVVLEGSGRFADELASAARTGETSQALLRSILSRGDIQLVSTSEGPKAVETKLSAAFESHR